MSAHRHAFSLFLVLTSVQAAAQEAPSSGLTLERAIELALERNVRSLTAEQRLKIAEARLDSARAAFFPDLTVTATYGRPFPGTTGTGDPTQGRVGLNAQANARLTLLDARAFPLYSAAAHEREASRLDALDERRLLAFDAARAFISALSLDQVVLAAERRLEFARETLKDAQSRFEAQLVSSNDVTKAKLEQATAERELVRARGDRETAYVTLGYVLAEDNVQGLTVPDAILSEAATATPQGEPMDKARGRRLDLAAQRERVESLKASALEPLMRLLPSLGLSANYRLTAPNPPETTEVARSGIAQVQLSWELFDGGERYAARRERLALARIAELQSVDLDRQLSAEVRSAAVSVTSAQAALKQAQVAFEAAEQNAKEIGILYRQGLTSALEVANAGVQLFDAQVELARERFGLAVAFFDLRAALGLDPLGREASK